jgi:Coenzyme PQQ synthesis protein D (PqqD)
MKFEETARFEVRESVHARRFDDELVVLHLSQGEYFALDEVGARVWEGLAAGRTMDGLCDAMLSTYEVGREQLWQDVMAFAEALVASGLMRVIPEGPLGLMHPIGGP